MDNFFGCRSTSKSNLTQSRCWFAFPFAAAQHNKFCSLATRLRQNLFTSALGARLEVGLGTFSTLQNEQFLCIFDFNLSILVLSSSFFLHYTEKFIVARMTDDSLIEDFVRDQAQWVKMVEFS